MKILSRFLAFAAAVLFVGLGVASQAFAGPGDDNKAVNVALTLAPGESSVQTFEGKDDTDWSVKTLGDSTIATADGFVAGKLKTQSVTFTGVSLGTTTYAYSGGGGKDATEYQFVIKVAYPPEIHLCVGDVVNLNYDMGKDKNASFAVAADDDGVATVSVTGQGNMKKEREVSLYRSCRLTMTATEVGETKVTLSKGDKDGKYTVYESIKLIVSPAREIVRNDTLEVGLACTELSAGNAAWTTDVNSAEPEGCLTASIAYAAAALATNVLTGVDNGTATVSASNVNTTEDSSSGAEYILAVTVAGAPTISVRLAPGASVTLDDLYKKGVSSTVYSVVPASEDGVTATVEKTGDTTARTTLTAAGDAEIGTTGAFLVAADGTEEVTHYVVTVIDPLRIEKGERVSGIAADSTVRYTVGSANAAVASVSASGTALNADFNATVTANAVGDTTVWAVGGTNAFGYAVRVYDVHERDLTLFYGEVPQAISLANANGCVGTWSATSSSPDLVGVSLSSAGPAANTVVTLSPIRDGVGAQSVTVSVTNEYHVETINVTLTKLTYDCGVRTVVIGGSIELKGSYDYRGPAWTGVSSSDAIATVTASGEAYSADYAVLEAKAVGTATITIENETALYTYTVMVVPEPYVVPFCEGDRVRIWYHNTTAKDWFILINDNKYSAVTSAGAVGRRGRQMRALVHADYLPNTDSYLDAWAETPGDAADGDLIVVSDGENFYAYRMSVAPTRVVQVGGTVDMTCSTVATNFWTSAPQVGSEDYVSVTNDPADVRSHSTVATITGRALTDAAYVEVSDQWHDATEVNAQGAIYYLKVRVEGTPMIDVHMTPEADLEVPQAYSHGANGVPFVIYANGSPVEGSEATVDGITFRFLSADDEGFVGRFEAAPSATVGTAVNFTVKCGDDEVVVYNVDIASGVFSMASGTVAPGVLYGAREPWVAKSSSNEVCSLRSVISDSLYTVEATPKKPGDVVVWATNPILTAGYWGIRSYVYDVATRNVSFTEDGASERFFVKDAAGLSGLWTAETTGPGIVSVELAENGANATGVWVTVTAAEGAHGPTSVTVKNRYHTEKINVYVGGGEKTVLRVPNAVTIPLGSTRMLPSESVGAAWAAYAENGNVFLVNAAGAAGELVALTGESLGTSLVSVESGDTIYIYTVNVTPKSGDATLPDVIVGVGASAVVTLADECQGALSVLSADRLIATVDFVPGSGVYTVSGQQDGETTVTISTGDTVYQQKITVHQQHIDKKLRLVLGADGTASFYSYTFDRVLSVENQNADRIMVTQNGDTVTLTPLAIGNAEVNVKCYVDGLAESSELHYEIEIVQLADPTLKIWQMSKDLGYIAYRGEADVVEDPASGDVTFVFTNVTEDGVIQVPDNYTAKTEVLAVGGGGGGGSTIRSGVAGAGGGAGGFAYNENRVLAAGTYGVSVGRGGVANTNGWSIGQSMPGYTGAPSIITNSFGYVFANASGGGGGGAPSLSAFNGLGGGSGGGGAWYSSAAGAGGYGTAGQGMSGGTPDVNGFGAGGGGAGGAGGSDGTGGAGKASAITGESVEYARGGAGGDASSSSAATSASGPGFGGNGANGLGNGFGTDGADGVVIVRVKDVYSNILVPIPSVSNNLVKIRYVWEDGLACVPFDYYDKTLRSTSNAHPYDWTNVIDHITGTTNVVCSFDSETTNKVGIGYYSFTVWLKDGFAWDDGSGPSGSTGGRRYMWTVVEDASTVDATLSVSKTVSWQDSSNATVSVSASSSPESSGGGGSSVLIIGSLCDHHGLSADVVLTTLRTAGAVADVDYYYFQQNSDDPVAAGHIAAGEGETFELPPEIPNPLNEKYGGSCRLIPQFYRQLDEVRQNGTKYDYIIFSFDAAKAAPDKADGIADMNEVSEWIRPYYDSGSVIWLCATADGGGGGPGGQQQQGGTFVPYSPSAAGGGKGGANVSLPMLGIFDPYAYADANHASHAAMATAGTPYPDDAYWHYDSSTYNGYYTNQVYYGNAGDVANLLGSVIKVKPFNLAYKDKIVDPAKGLTITGVTVQGCVKCDDDGIVSTNAEDWVEVISWYAEDGRTEIGPGLGALGIAGASLVVDTDSNTVEACLSNVTQQVWTRFDTHVVDDGTFRSSEGATYNESTGQYEKNPNDGAVNISMLDDYGAGIGIDAEAETETLWKFDGFVVSGSADGGEIFINGGREAQLALYSGGRVEVFYRGYGGYRLASVLVDDEERYANQPAVAQTNDYMWVFDPLNASHKVAVTYVKFASGVATKPATNQYDGAAHLFPLEFDAGWDPSVEVEVRYSLDPNGPFLSEADFLTDCETNDVAIDIGTYEVFYRVYAFQSGYGDNLKEPGWVWVDLGIDGSEFVTITPRTVTITPNAFHLSADEAPAKGPLAQEFFNGVTIAGLLGNDLVNTNGTLWFTCPDYQYVVGQYRIEVDLVPGFKESDVVGPNYHVVFLPNSVSVIRSAMTIGGVAQSSVLDPEVPNVNTGVDRVEKIYDGVATNLTVDVQMPEEGYHVLYSTDDGASWGDTLPVFWEAGTNKVWYAVECDESEGQEALFFPVTNYNYVIILPRPLEITAASDVKRYDGTPLTTSGYEVTAGDLASGDDFDTVRVVGSVTTVGSVPSAVDSVVIKRESADVTANYALVLVEGLLKVTPACFVIGGVEQPDDPSVMLEFDENGVDAVTIPYTGEGTNITVDVTYPADGVTVKFSTNRNDSASWTTETLVFTNAGVYTVWFVVEAGNFAPVTNFTAVTIQPREVTVAAKDSGKTPGSEDPALGWTVMIDGSEPQLLDEVAAQVHDILDDSSEISVSRDEGEDPADYQMTVTGPETILGGNFKITYAPGVFTITDDVIAKSLWIVDHADGGHDTEGNHFVRLAFQPTLNVAVTMTSVRKLVENGIKVVHAASEAALATSEQTYSVKLLEAETERDCGKGWIWIQVTVPDSADLSTPDCWKVVLE